MPKVKPSFNGPMMMLAAPGMPPLYVDLEKVYKSPVTTGIIWGQTVVACDCGDEAARWISQFLYHEPAGLRLFYYPLRKATRQVRGGYRNFPHNQDVDYVRRFLQKKMSVKNLLHYLNEKFDFRELIQT